MNTPPRLVSRGNQPLMLDIDTQTEETTVLYPAEHRASEPSVDSTQINYMHIDLVSRLTELEIQNSEMRDELKTIASVLTEFKTEWDRKSKAEKDSDILLRNMRVFS
jgi:hypothetical protein